MNASEKIKALNLTQPATYRIRVPGHLNQPWSEWFAEITIRFEMENAEPVTELIVKVDQAALQGLMRRLYNMGLPIISIEYLDEPGDTKGVWIKI